MFSQKKSFFKGKLFYIILVGLFLFGYWINQSPVIENPEDVDTDSKIPIENNENTPNQQGSYDIMDNIIGGSNLKPTEETDKNNETEENNEAASNSYYLVKEVDGIIKIFYYDDQGNESLVRTTDIAFSLLSVSDQALFKQGIIKHNVEELNELLQDFES